MNADAEEIASIYDEFGEYYHNSRRSASGRLANEFIDMPAVLSLIPSEIHGWRVVDAGCGSGIYAAILGERGAGVIGIDASQKMIEIAEREKPDGLDISYMTGDISDMQIPDRFADLVMSNYVLENVKDIDAAFREFYRVMKPGGMCVISISHPLRAQASREKRADQEVWVLEDYFADGIRRSDFGGGMIVPKYKRTIESYTEAIAGANLMIRRLLEPQPVPEGSSVDPAGYGTALRLPQLLAMELTRDDMGVASKDL